MKTQLRNTDLNVLAKRLEAEQLAKRDLVVPSNAISMNDGLFQIQDLPTDMFAESELNQLLSDFRIDGSEPLKFSPTEVARIHVAHKLSMPRKFYRYLESEHLDMLDYNVSELFARSDKNFFVRSFAPTEDTDIGIFRALLSDRYQVVDNIDVLWATLQAIKETDANVKIGRCNLSEEKMYIEFLRPEANITAEDYFNRYNSPDGGDDGNIYAGFVISNSEVGMGSYSITPRAIVGACKNGLVFKKDAMRKTHLGSQMDEGIQWSQETQNKQLALIKSQISDAVTHFMSEDFLQGKIDDMRRHTGRLVHPTKATENVCKQIGISDDEKNDVLNYFIEGGDFSPVGVVQAITYHAHEQEDADKQYHYEAEAMKVLPDIAKKFDYSKN